METKLNLLATSYFSVNLSYIHIYKEFKQIFFSKKRFTYIYTDTTICVILYLCSFCFVC
jgi:hypothetical protein